MVILRVTCGLWHHIRMHFASHVVISRTIGLCHEAYVQYQADTASQKKNARESESKLLFLRIISMNL